MAQIQTKNNPVVHPNHYNWLPNIECLDVVEYFNFNLGCAIKYVWRVPVKNRDVAIIDLRKAVFYLEREIERIKLEESYFDQPTKR